MSVIYGEKRPDVPGRRRVVLSTPGPGRTKQAHKKECDINVIMAKYQKSGLLTHVAQHEGRYEDVTGSLSYHEAMNVVVRAQRTFDSLPASIRNKFGNDPGKFLEFATDPKNADGMVELGLMPKKAEAPPPQKVEVVNPAPAAAGAGAKS